MSGMFISCVTSYYQIYKTIPSENTILKDDFLVYEDENCMVLYNFWSEGGNMVFLFHNKTDENIYLNLGESFFIYNGIAYNYYRNRTFTFSKASSSSSSVSSSSINTYGISVSKSNTDINYSNLVYGLNLISTLTNIAMQEASSSSTNTKGQTISSEESVSYNEEKIVCIPSKTTKIISEYIVNEHVYKDCDLSLFPKKKDIKSKMFSKEVSPFVFSNRLSYYIEGTTKIIRFENEFYVSEISNHTENEIIEWKYVDECNKPIDIRTVPIRQFINVYSPTNFYIKYP
jgi:hypothetical protein